MTGRSLYVMAFAIALTIVGLATALLVALSPDQRGPTPQAVAAPPPAADGSLLLPTTPAWTEAGSDPTELSWSPDGRMLVYAVPRAFGTVRLMAASVDDDGRAIAEAVAPSGEASGQRFRLMQRPSWDGSTILFEGTLERSAVRRTYSAAPGDDAATAVVTDGLVDGNVQDAKFDQPKERLVYVHADLQSSDLELFDVRSRRSKKLSPADGDESAPVFAPDGKSVVFARRKGDDTDLYRVDLQRGRIEPFAQGVGHQDHATSLPSQGKAAPRWLMVSSADRRVGDLVLLEDNSPRVLESGIQVPPGHLAVSPDGEWVASLPATRDDLVVLSRIDANQRVLIRTGMHPISYPTLGVRDGRIRLAYVAGETGSRSVYISDITDVLAAPPPLTAAAPAPAHQE